MTKPALSDHARNRSVRRVSSRVGAIVALASLTIAGCTSDPGARRVAEDIIRAETEDDTSSDRRDCMLQVLEDDFSDSDLEDITNQIGGTNEGSQAEGQAALDEFEAALASCN